MTGTDGAGITKSGMAHLLAMNMFSRIGLGRQQINPYQCECGAKTQTNSEMICYLIAEMSKPCHKLIDQS
jgi:hypothetical protein